ncbi:hypothetical protein B1B04_09230 [Lysinibacillus sp. KCTC 33748]|uniref:hypothetical protein n=1 Tax=unclassified Lysinibacillus TaxID=2636778 RepID=UPI0009A7E31B|nr:MULTISPECIES: hypothetical protein [unclassified Lysinibacillus]OXS74298.1 hypothetical protein B1B04_09230 [Lysinibacillus sp. KCTC 33748]SKB63912.1 hypothetical protein SAMN06295926_10528 [Lysinibacillus sp. AC-3]
MEKSNGGLELDIVTNNTFDNDDIKETIVGYGKNFSTIEKYLTEAIEKPEDLPTGQVIEGGKIIWNKNPVIGGYVGWVNIREGLNAPSWKPKVNYTVGQEIKAKPDNGNIYRCVTAGKSMVHSPTFLVGEGVEFYDANGNKWFPNYNYQVNDVIFAVNGSKLYYYICETAGITGTSEPIWSSVLPSSTVVDGSVVWRKEATVKWKQVGISSEFRPFGKVE